MTNRRGTRARMKIEENTKYEDTRPEDAFQELCTNAGIQLEDHPKVSFLEFELTPDFRVEKTIVYVAIDGEKFHLGSARKRNKDAWRDEQMISRGLRLFHIEAELLVFHNVPKAKQLREPAFTDSKHFHPYVLKALKEFIASKESVKYLRA